MILDTNGLSALAEGDPDLEPIFRKATQIAVPVIALGEYRYGIQQSRERQRYEHWIVEYLPKFRVLSVDEQTTTSYAAVRVETQTLQPSGRPCGTVSRFPEKWKFLSEPKIFAAWLRPLFRQDWQST
jgi:PIN domain